MCMAKSYVPRYLMICHLLRTLLGIYQVEMLWIVKGFHWSKLGAFDQNCKFTPNESLHIRDNVYITEVSVF